MQAVVHSKYICGPAATGPSQGRSTFAGLALPARSLRLGGVSRRQHATVAVSAPPSAKKASHQGASEVKIFLPDVDRTTHVIATYQLAGRKSLRDAAWELAIGQSVGNPHVRNVWESDDLFDTYSAKILGDEGALLAKKEGVIEIAFPACNTDWVEDGVTQLLVQVMGGQLDIDQVTHCRLLKLEFPQSVLKTFKGPKFGIPGIRKFTGVHDRPLLGAICKPKTGISPSTLLDMVKAMVDGGVNFIKEDEILSNPAFCKIEDRVPMIMNYLAGCGRNVVYAVCINADPPYLLKRVQRVHDLGGNGIHVNFWAGMGTYKAIREMDLPLFMHFQKSGDKILTDTTHRFSIDFTVIMQLAGLMGVDFAHAGMWGGYSSTEATELTDILRVMHAHSIMPALSCGMHPGLVNAVEGKFGIEFMANTGGAVHGHPGGTMSGARAMRQAIDLHHDAPEYVAAVAKWGLIQPEGKPVLSRKH